MNFESVFLWIAILLWCLTFFVVLNASFKNNSSTKNLAADAMFIAIIFIMGFIPQMGYISLIPGLSLTLMHLPLLLGAMLYGCKRGLLYGFAFGITSFLQALTSGAGLNALFIYPWISILPRIIFGFLGGFLFQLLRKKPKLYTSLATQGGLCFLLSLLHTSMVFALLFLSFPKTMSNFFLSQDILVSSLGATFLIATLLGALGEAILAAILVPLFGRALLVIKQRSSY